MYLTSAKLRQPIKTVIENKHPKLIVGDIKVFAGKTYGLRIDISKVITKRTKKGVIFGIWNAGAPIIESKINWY